MNPEDYTAICNKCGAALKYPLMWQGKVWGGDCLDTHMGTSIWQRAVVGNVIDEAKLAQLKAERADAEARYAEETAQRSSWKQLTAARLEYIKAHPVAMILLEKVKSFKPNYYRPLSFHADLLYSLFTKGYLSAGQLAALKLKDQYDPAIANKPDWKYDYMTDNDSCYELQLWVTANKLSMTKLLDCKRPDRGDYY